LGIVSLVFVCITIITKSLLSRQPSTAKQLLLLHRNETIDENIILKLATRPVISEQNQAKKLVFERSSRLAQQSTQSIMNRSRTLQAIQFLKFYLYL